MNKFIYAALIAISLISCDSNEIIECNEKHETDLIYDETKSRLKDFSNYPDSLIYASSLQKIGEYDYYVSGLLNNKIWIGRYAPDKKTILHSYLCDYFVDINLTCISTNGTVYDFKLNEVEIYDVYIEDDKYIYCINLSASKYHKPQPYNYMYIFTNNKQTNNIEYISNLADMKWFRGFWHKGYVEFKNGIYTIDGDYCFKPALKYKINGEMQELDYYWLQKTSFDKGLYAKHNGTSNASIHRIDFTGENNGLIWEKSNDEINSDAVKMGKNCFIGGIDVTNDENIVYAKCYCGSGSHDYNNHTFIIKYDLQTGKLIL